MEIDSSWASIVERYLQAYYQENKVQRDARLTNSLSEVFREFGSETVAVNYFLRAKDYCQSLQAPPPRSEWELISHSDSSVIVEIPVDAEDNTISDQVPFLTTRILLSKREDGEWKFDDILQPCVSCNMSYRHRKTIAGKCTLCEGIGHFRFTEDHACSYCSGTGKCPKCKDESTMGWRSSLFLCPKL